MSGTNQVEAGETLDDRAAPPADEGRSDTEAQARRMGWVPREEFRGDVNNWRPAAEFLDRGMNLLPVLQQQYRSLEGKHSRLEGQYEQSQRTLMDLTERMRRTDERAYKRAMRDLEARRAQAVQNGDTEAFREVETEMSELRESAPPPAATQTERGPAPADQTPPAPRPQQTQTVVPPEVERWVQDNQWFQTNAEARQDAIAIQQSIDQQYPHLSLTERLAKTRQKISAMHPALFENPRRSQPPAVGGSTPGGRPPVNPRGFDAMPQESKQEYQRYLKVLDGKGKPLTKEEWAQYYWENEQ